MKFLANHFASMGTTRWSRAKKVMLCYGIPTAVAVAVWGLWERSVTGNSLSIIATVQSVVATVLLTVMGSIYSGLPAAVRRVKRSREQAAPREPSQGAVDIAKQLRGPLQRVEFESTRLDVLRNLFSHTATAVAYALLSLPLVVGAVQLADTKSDVARRVASCLELAVLVLACITIAVVFLVLVDLHELVSIDSKDADPPQES